MVSLIESTESEISCRKSFPSIMCILHLFAAIRDCLDENKFFSSSVNASEKKKKKEGQEIGKQDIRPLKKEEVLFN